MWPCRDPTQTFQGLFLFLKTLSLICAHWLKLKTRTVKSDDCLKEPSDPPHPEASLAEASCGRGRQGPEACGPGGGGRPPGDTPPWPGRQRLSLTLYEDDDEEEKRKTKPQMPKEFQWDELPPPLREYLEGKKERNRSECHFCNLHAKLQTIPQVIEKN